MAPDDLKPFSIYDEDDGNPPKLHLPKVPAPEEPSLGLEIEEAEDSTQPARPFSPASSPALPESQRTETRDASPFLHGESEGSVAERSQDLLKKRRAEGKIHDRRRTASIFDKPIEPDRPILEGKKSWHPFSHASRSLWFLMPALLAFGLFYLYPTVQGFFVSLTHFHPLGGGTPVGWANYRRALGDPVFQQTVLNATSFTFLSLLLSFWPPIILAIVLNELKFARPVFRVLFLLPFVLPAVPAANLWRWMYDAGFGLFNALLAQAPGSPQVGWLTDPRWSLLCIAVMFAWKNMGWYLILYYAALQNLPEERYEAAELDGAGVFQKVYHITLPHLRPVMGMLIILQVLNAFQIFTEVFVMTGGGPMRTTEVLGTYIYKTAFEGMDLGYASAMGMLLFAALFAFSTVRVALLRRTEV